MWSSTAAQGSSAPESCSGSGTTQEAVCRGSGSTEEAVWKGSGSTEEAVWKGSGSTEEAVWKDRSPESWAAGQRGTARAPSTLGTKDPGKDSKANRRKTSAIVDFFETRNDVLAADDDDDDELVGGGVVATNPRFVRSFNKRIRTREQRGWRCKTLSGPMDWRQPGLGERGEARGTNGRDENEAEEDLEGKCRGRSGSETDLATVSGKNEKDVFVRSTARLRVASSGNGTDIDIADHLYSSSSSSSSSSSGSDDVFWPATDRPSASPKDRSIFYDSVPRVDESARSPRTNEREERGGCRRGTKSKSKSSATKASKPSVDGSSADGEVPGCGEDSGKSKEYGIGFSFFSRLSKNVSVRRKYGKSHTKSHIFSTSDKKLIEKAMACKENLESILETSQERCMDEGSHQSQWCEAEGSTQDWKVNDNADQCSARQALECNLGCDPSSSRDPRRPLKATIDKGNSRNATPGHHLGRYVQSEASTASFRLVNSSLPVGGAATTTPPSVVPAICHNPTPDCESGSCSPSELPDLKSPGVQENVSGTDQSSDIMRTVSTAFHSFWPGFLSNSPGSSRPQDEEAVSKTLQADPDWQTDTSLISHHPESLTVFPAKSRDEVGDGLMKASEYSCSTKVHEDDNQQPLLFPDSSSSSQPHCSNDPTHGKPSQNDRWKDGITQKKGKFFPGFAFHSESTARKTEAEKGPGKEKNLKKDKNIANERKTDSWGCMSQTRLRRVGAIKKSDDCHLLLLDDGSVSLTSVITTSRYDSIAPSDLQKPFPNTDSPTASSSEKPVVPSGAISKGSYLHRAFQEANWNDARQKTPNESKTPGGENSHETNCEEEASRWKKESGKSFKKRSKRQMERSISVPFWAKFHSQESISLIAPSDNGGARGALHQLQGAGDDTQVIVEREKDAAKAKPKADGGPSSPAAAVNPKRKLTHKRARSQDLTKALKHEGFSIAPERSASHDNINKLRQEEEEEEALLEGTSMLAVDIPDAQSESSTSRAGDSSHPVDSPPFDTMGFRTPHKNLSCGDIIDIGRDESDLPTLARRFRDSKSKSASALCLSTTGTKRVSGAKGRERRVSPAPLGEDSCASGTSSPPSPGDSSGEGRNQTPAAAAPRLLYISPFDILTDTKDRPYLQRLLGLFFTDSKMDSLVQQLDMYSKVGIPRQPHLLACQTLSEQEDVVIEDSWRKLVEGNEQLDEKGEQQQSAIWELVETEATYIHMLKVITDLFLACLCNLQNESLLYEVDTDKLFSNIQEIYNANLSFWSDHITRMLDASRSSRQPLDPTLLNEAFFKFDELFHPYTRYCLEQSNCQLYCKEKDHDNEYFKMYLAWCETQKECNRLRLVDILVQPMQRLTKYSLLLKAILKKTTLEDHKLCLQEMIAHVENFVSNVNSALRHKHEQERLRDIAKRIEAYEAVEARDDELERVVRNYSDLNLTQPMPGCPEHLPRHLLHHGDLRLRDPHTSKMDVHVFLFTDLLLITKVTQRKAEKVKIVRPPYHVERLVLVELKDSTSIGLVSINEWNVAVAAFTLQCPDQRTHRTWYDTLRRAKDQYKEAQQAQDALVYEDMTCVGHLAPRSPRSGSSRASRVSSLAHSHSGSIDLNEASPATQHHPSIDMSEVRASSASSDDSVALPAPEIQRSRSLEGGGCGGAISPRPDRRPGFPKTPNTLSVTPPYATGQSLPNLTVESANSLRVPGANGSNPKALLSPCNRGVSYPPPSPRTLRRSAPVPQSRNPPLIKTRHVTSMAGSPQEVDQSEQEDPARGGLRRIYRTDRMDNRRYHTAGAIDDIKKQDTKDATIHKRLSWNYGQGPPPSRDLGNDQGKLGRHKHAVKNISCESVHSSSGVSSTSSLHRSMGSEVEALENIDDNEADGEATVVDLTVSDCTSLKISPHISTTYICHDSDITLGVCSQYITQPNSTPEPGEACENLVKIDVSETDPGISSVQITVTEGATSSSSSNMSSTSPSESAPVKPDNMRMREILLNDASVEASDV